MSESGKKPSRKREAEGESDKKDSAGTTPRARRLEGTDEVWSGVAETTSDPNLEPWLVEELRRIYDDVLYEPIPQDMLDILRRAGDTDEAPEDAEERRRRLERERAIVQFRRSGGSWGGQSQH